MPRDAQRQRRAWAVADAREVLLAAVVLLAFLQTIQVLVPFTDSVYRAFVTGRGFRDPPSLVQQAGWLVGWLAIVTVALAAPRFRSVLATRAGLALALAAAGVLRVGVALAPTGRVLFMAAVALLAVLLLVLPAVLDRARRRGEPGTVGPALFLAFLFENAFRVLGASLDVTLTPHLPIAAGAVGLALAAGGLVPAMPPRDEAFHPHSGSGHRALLAGVGLYLALNLLAQAAPLARWTGASHGLATALIALAVIAGAGVHAWRVAKRHLAWPLAFAPLAAVAAIAWLPASLAGVTVVLAAVALAAVVDAVAIAFTAEARRAGGRLPRFWVALLAAFFAFSYAHVLPFARAPDFARFGESAVLALFAFAALLFVPGALLGREPRTRPSEAPRLTRPAAMMLAVVTIAPFLAFPFAGAGVDAALAAEAPDARDAGAGEFVVVTFNAHQGVGPAGRVDWIVAANALRALDADVIALQEAEAGRAARGSTDGVLVLARALGMDGAFAPTIGRAYGNAVLSRAPIVDAETILLPSLAEQRGAARARILIDDRPVDVYSTHLGFSVTERGAQGARIAERIADADVTAFVGGDFNAFATNAGGRALEAAGLHRSQALAEPDPPFTFTTSHPRRAIDFIYATPDVTFLDHRVVDAVVSDHFPVRAVARLP